MNGESKVRSKNENPRGAGLWVPAGAALFGMVCAFLAAPGVAFPARAQGSTPTYTPPTPYQCMYVQYAYVTESEVVVGVNNNTSSTTRLRSAALTWPSALGGSGGDYVDWFRWKGNQFYNGNDSSPPTSANVPNNATYQIVPGETGEFLARFGPDPLNRPLYGSFTITLRFRNNCTVSITVTRASDCPIITASSYSRPNVNYTVYNSTASAFYLTSADYDWPDAPNRYINNLLWAGSAFYTPNTYDPPILNAVDSTPNTLNPFAATTFRANFGNPGTMVGGYTATLRFSNGCAITYTHWIGMTPTPTVAATPTETATPVPLQGVASVAYSAILLNAPDFGLPAQTIRGRVLGGGGDPYTVLIRIEDPDGNVATYGQNVELDGTFELLAAETGDTYFGCGKEGIWEAWYEVTDALGGSAESNHVTWAVNFPRAHGVP
ncbi:MAG: hypothetical protein JW929_14170 [Anaerolineales bacterium]|nr:hypothetical protein [Anaerolineales bacterium]